MAVQGSAYLSQETTLVLNQGSFTVILSNASSITYDDDIDILIDEPSQSGTGYAPVSIYSNVSASLGSYDTVNSRWALTSTNAGFSCSGTSYTYQWVIVWQGRGTTANKQISSIDTSTDRLTVTSHGLTSGDRAFISTAGSLPSGYTQAKNWVEVIDSNTIKLHTNSGLSAPVNFTDSGSGTQVLRYANGNFVRAENVGSTTLNSGQSKTYTIQGIRKYA